MRPVTMHLGLVFALMVGGTVLVRADGSSSGDSGSGYTNPRRNIRSNSNTGPNRRKNPV